MASVYATSSNGHYVYATVTWDSNLKVTVNITSANAGWCVKIRGTSTIKCQGSSSNRTGTFTADYDGQEFTLQVYDLVEESFVNNGNPVFAVTNNNSGGNSGSGGSSGGGSYVPSESVLYIHEGEGTKVNVVRIYLAGNSPSENYYGKLVNGIEEWHDGYCYYKHAAWQYDRVLIEVEALPGYTLDTYTVNDGIHGDMTLNYYVYGFILDDPNNMEWRVDNGITVIEVTATKNDSSDESQDVRGVFYIDNGSGFDKYEMWIDNGTSWDLVTCAGSSSGTNVQRISGSFGSSNTLYEYTDVSCGFKPDLVSVHLGYDDKVTASAPFEGLGTDDVYTTIHDELYNRYLQVNLCQNENGFSYCHRIVRDDGSYYADPITIVYTAVKYT